MTIEHLTSMRLPVPAVPTGKQWLRSQYDNWTYLQR